MKYSDSNIEYSVPNIPKYTNIEVEVIKSSANPNRGMDIVETIQIFFLLTNLNSKRSKSQ